MDLYTLIIFCALTFGVSGTGITADKKEISAEEGSRVTLSCSYTSNDYLYWYRQYPGSPPKFLVLILDGTTKDQKSDVDPRFTAKLTKGNNKHVHLEISSAALLDSAVYYCAMNPNDGSWKIQFGKGTTLHVQSKEVKKPSFYKVNDSCLATDFTRHDALNEESAFTGQNISVRYEGESTYSAFGWGTGNDCKEGDDCKDGSSDHESIPLEIDEKMNFISLGIFWLRILFLKTVVFNVLMTLKARIS